MKVESHIGTIAENADNVYTFLSDFRNLEPLVPKEKLSSSEFTRDTCKLGIPGLGEIELKILEQDPPKLIKLGSGPQSAYPFTLWIQLKQMAEKDTRVKVTLETRLNPFLEMMAKNPLQQFVDTLADKMGTIPFNEPLA